MPLAVLRPGVDELKLLASLQSVVKPANSLVDNDLWASNDIADCFDGDEKQEVDRLADLVGDGSSDQPGDNKSAFAVELADFRKRVALSQAPPSGDRMRKRMKTGAGAQARPAAVPADVFSLAEAWSFFPPGCTVTKSNWDNRYRVSHPILGKKSRTWTLHTERGALGPSPASTHPRRRPVGRLDTHAKGRRVGAAREHSCQRPPASPDPPTITPR